mmetsp:Transcript_27380/g.89600  ORF Transcript_27380/g.89600 Transcript_27380/m.89600 type:complete len:455 (-) Transcript_27380:1001-2365(-)
MASSMPSPGSMMTGELSLGPCTMAYATYAATAVCGVLALFFILKAVSPRLFSSSSASSAPPAAMVAGADKVSILAIGTAVPPYKYTSAEFEGVVQNHLKYEKGVEDWFIARVKGSAVDSRNFCVDPKEFSAKNLAKPPAEREGIYAGACELSGGREFNPTAGERAKAWEEWAPKLAVEAADKAVKAWGGDKRTITHVIFHSCTGFKAPGVELDIVDKLALTGVRRRLGINYMGCFGAFTGLSVAKSFVASEPGAVVLLVCTELCSLHVTMSESRSEMIGNCIFADGAAAAVVGAGKEGDWSLARAKTITLGQDTRDMMTWHSRTHAYRMWLDKSIGQSMAWSLFGSWKQMLLGVCGTDDPSKLEWALHPGGKGILEGFCDPRLGTGLNEQSLRHSWNVLREHGNMSSPTILFVLQRVMKEATRDKIFAMGFGPGLTVETLGLERLQPGADSDSE